MSTSRTSWALALVILAAVMAAGCKEPNNEQTSSDYKKLSPDEAKKRLDETMARRQGKLPPANVRPVGEAKTP